MKALRRAQVYPKNVLLVHILILSLNRNITLISQQMEECWLAKAKSYKPIMVNTVQQTAKEC